MCREGLSRSVVVLWLVLALVWVGPLATAEELASADSLRSNPIDTTRTDSPGALPHHLTVTLDHGEVLQATRVEWRSSDFVRVYDSNGQPKYVATFRVKSIVGSDGRDWTKAVVAGRATVGPDGQLPGSPEKHEAFGAVLVGLAVVAVIIVAATNFEMSPMGP